MSPEDVCSRCGLYVYTCEYCMGDEPRVSEGDRRLMAAVLAYAESGVA